MVKGCAPEGPCMALLHAICHPQVVQCKIALARACITSCCTSLVKDDHLLQVGCGVGNTAYPLLEINKHSKVYACDFAASAVKLVKEHPQYSCGRMHAFVADITCDDLRTEVPAKAVDICTMVFVLSAITPAKMPQARTCRLFGHQALLLIRISCCKVPEGTACSKSLTSAHCATP